MAGRKQNLTLVVDADVLRAARQIALDRHSSVARLVREYLASVVQESSRRRLARARLKAVIDTGLIEIGGRTWTRDELHER